MMWLLGPIIPACLSLCYRSLFKIFIRVSEDWVWTTQFRPNISVLLRGLMCQIFQCPPTHTSCQSVFINQWWNSLSEGHRTVSGIIAANVVVFCCWRVPSLQRSMMKYFTSNPASKTLCLPMLLSTFSHYSFFHMAANMYVLWSFSSSIVSILGREQFLAVYLSAGVISTMFSYVCKTASGRLGPSLGASGAIMTVLAAVCTKMPEAKLAIIFLPMYAFSAGTALKAILAMDTAGLFLGWRYFDHAAHLGGALFGMWYIMYGHELIWKNREPLVKVWHDLRTKGPGRGGSGGSGPL
uniref:rhomboid protease n=1 Tax=Esox lucius TaxID=8010 RepID=A0AAY5KU16_ESOLU